MRETGKVRTEGTDGEFLAVHPDVVERVLEKQPQDEYLYDLAELFKVFGDTTRIKILYALFESELCVGDITSAAHPERFQAGEVSQRWQDHLLFAGR